MSLVWLIGACEIAFWVVLGVGLAVRYVLRWPRVSTVVLLGVPLIDVVLVTASIVHVARGAEPDWTHGLAAVYLGFTVAFGPTMIRWADVRFAHRFAGGPPPPPKPRGRAKLAYEWREWGKAVVAWVIAIAAMTAIALAAGDGIPTPFVGWISGEPMWQWAARITAALVIWFIGWPLWETLSPSSDKTGASESTDSADAADRRARR